MTKVNLEHSVLIKIIDIILHLTCAIEKLVQKRDNSQKLQTRKHFVRIEFWKYEMIIHLVQFGLIKLTDLILQLKCAIEKLHQKGLIHRNSNQKTCCGQQSFLKNRWQGFILYTLDSLRYLIWSYSSHVWLKSFIKKANPQKLKP